jgi:hypothetical protein
VTVRVLVAAGLLVAPYAHADPTTLGSPRRGTESEPGTTHPTAPTPNRINLRLGNSTSDSTGRPVICLDVRIWSGLGVESCGTGQGVIHDEVGTELAHFRATWSIIERGTSSGTGRLRGGLGWSELQVGVDHPGFHFGEPDPTERGSVAGPEAALQGQFLVPLAKGVEAIASVTAGLAIFSDADKLVVPQSNVQPFASFELGVGW